MLAPLLKKIIQKFDKEHVIVLQAHKILPPFYYMTWTSRHAIHNKFGV